MKVEIRNCPKCYTAMQYKPEFGIYVCPNCGIIRDKRLNWIGEGATK